MSLVKLKENKLETESAKSELEKLKNETSTNLRLKEGEIEKFRIEMQKETQIVAQDLPRCLIP